MTAPCCYTDANGSSCHCQRRKDAEAALRMIVSHATMGRTTGAGQSVNDICVQITDVRNRIVRETKAAAIPAAPAPTVKVKPLVWVKHPTKDIWRCDTSSGVYKVFGIGASPSWDFDGFTSDGKLVQVSQLTATVEAAKAAAQADYEGRILSAIEVTP